MAGDWIKMRVDLWHHPRIVRMVSALNADKATVCGALFRTWSLADQYTEDGRLAGYTPEALDSEIGIKGWSNVLEAAEWLELEAGAVIVPRFDEHNGQSAKRRVMERERKRRGRSGSQAARKLSASDADKKRPREEKIEITEEPPPPPGWNWREVEKELQTLGLADYRKTMRDAQERNETPDDVHRIISQWRAARDRFDKPLGALAWWLQTGKPPKDFQRTPMKSRQTSLDVTWELDRSRLVRKLRADGFPANEIEDEVVRRLGEKPNDEAANQQRGPPS